MKPPAKSSSKSSGKSGIKSGLKSGVKPSARSRARRLAMQAIYEWQLNSNSPEKIAIEYVMDKDMNNVDEAFFRELFIQSVDQRRELDEHIKPYLSRDLEEIDPVELAILRMGCYELKQRMDTPYRVVINEAVELAKKFGADQSHKFVNGIMDKLASELRQFEVKANKK